MPAAFWAEFFGTKHLGSIKALATSVMVFGSAIGPGMTGFVIDRGIDFPQQMQWIAVYFLASAAIATYAVAQVRHELPASS
jgi:MFS family permease